MLKGFRDFIMRGNVIDLAVAFVIGAAFTALVQAFVKGLIDPIVRIAMGGSADNLGGTITVSGQVIDFGLIINAIITFLITAAVVYFVFVAPMNAYRKRTAKPAEEAPEAEEVALLREIRDALRQQADAPTQVQRAVDQGERPAQG
jgi:large conductance mechanosensitive channel